MMASAREAGRRGSFAWAGAIKAAAIVLIATIGSPASAQVEPQAPAPSTETATPPAATPSPTAPPQAPAAAEPSSGTSDRIEPSAPTATQPGDAGAPSQGSTPAVQPVPNAAPSEDAAPASTPFGNEAATPVTAAPAERNAALPHDLSPWGMFMAADWVVKAVMIGLAFASLVTWTIWLAKTIELSFAKGRASSAVRRIERSDSLGEAIGEGRGPLKRGPVAALARAAEEERARSGALGADGVKERAAVALSRIEARAGRRMARGTGLLATIGSTAPFVGLFGTVWGIMNSFIGISQANTTNLAVVAPGIAEALLATAIGLVAAIPAVIIYNVFSRSIAGYRVVLADGSAAILQHLSRDLDRRDHAARERREASDYRERGPVATSYAAE